jgi:hypothetical protein
MGQLKATLNGVYNRNGEIVNRYVVSGSAADIAEFKKIQGQYFREDTQGRPLYFRPKFDPQGRPHPSTMLIEPNYRGDGFVPVYDTILADAEYAESIGGVVGQELGKALAQELLEKRRALRGNTRTAALDAPVSVAQLPMDDDFSGSDIDEESVADEPVAEKPKAKAKAPVSPDLGDI